MAARQCGIGAGMSNHNVAGIALLLAATSFAGDSPAEPPLRYGELMAELARRFETMGRAAKARRYEMASYELDEIGEIFEEDLPHAEPPKVFAQVNLAGLTEAFKATHPPELDAALKGRDLPAFNRAFARAAATCNGCHVASGHPYIEIPTTPGTPVPRLDPVPDKPAPKP